MLPLAIQLTQLQLSLAVTGSCSLTQQLETDAAVALAVAVMAEQPSQAALGNNHTFECRLLEHPPGDTFDALGLS